MVNHIGEVMVSIFTLSVQWSTTSVRQHAHRFFHLGVHVPFYLHFWGYIQIFGGAISNSSFGGTKKINFIFSTQGRAPCCFFYKYYAELAKTFFFCLTLGQTGSGVLSDPWSLCLSHHFFL